MDGNLMLPKPPGCLLGVAEIVVVGVVVEQTGGAGGGEGFEDAGTHASGGSRHQNNLPWKGILDHGVFLSGSSPWQEGTGPSNQTRKPCWIRKRCERIGNESASEESP